MHHDCDARSGVLRRDSALRSVACVGRGHRHAPSAPSLNRFLPSKHLDTESLAAEVQAQTVRLRERLASPPAPREPLRNPFAFASREQRQRPHRRGGDRAAAPAAPDAVPEPPLTLIGVAEQLTPKGLERTAIITADSDEALHVEGRRRARRTVSRQSRRSRIAVELTDLVTGAVRSLVLR